jgi:hypothetical protein
VYISFMSGCMWLQSSVTPAANPDGVQLGLYGQRQWEAVGVGLTAAVSDEAVELVVSSEDGLWRWDGPWRGVFDLHQKAEPIELPPDAQPEHVLAVGGELVIVDCDPAERDVRVWRGDVDGFGTEPVWTAAGRCGHGSAYGSVGDRDGDGHEDLAFGLGAPDEIVLTRGSWPEGDEDRIRLSPAAFSAELGLQSVTVAGGDLDHDGGHDLVVGEPGGRRVLVFFALQGERSDEEADLVLQGPGTGLALADLDGDGVDDLAAGGPTEEGGEVWIWFGPLSEAEPPDVVFAQERIGFGSRLVPLDHDGDGRDELVVFSPGPVHILDGQVSGPISTWSLLSMDQDEPLHEGGGLGGDGLGAAAVVADFDGDGIEDLIAGAPTALGVGAAFGWFGAP